jgi:hypothetical protein
MIGGRYVPGLCWGGFVRIVPGTGVPGDSPVWRIRIVNFLKRITELPGCVRSLSGCRCGRDSVFRAGWTINQGQLYRGWRQTQFTRGCPSVNHLGCWCRFPTGGALNRVIRTAPVSPKPCGHPALSPPLLHRNIARIRAAQRGPARQMMASVRAQNEGLTWTPCGSKKSIAPDAPGRNTPVAQLSSRRGFDVPEVAEHTN